VAGKSRLAPLPESTFVPNKNSDDSEENPGHLSRCNARRHTVMRFDAGKSKFAIRARFGTTVIDGAGRS
jgi:hypothetical protein